MKIIGHRGAAGLELENSLASLRKAVALGVDGVEFDVRLTSDGHLVLCHDASPCRVSDSHDRIANLTLVEVRQIRLYNGEVIPTLEEALDVLRDTVAYIEPKDDGSAAELLKVIAKFPKSELAISTFRRDLAAEIKQKRPDLKVYIASYLRPFRAINFASKHGLDGVTLHFSAVGRMTYWLALRNRLEVAIYTVNRRWLASLLNFSCPGAAIVTDRPDRLKT